MNDNEPKDIRYITVRTADFLLLHPSCKERFSDLRFRLKEGFRRGNTFTDFREFETYRHPFRQNEAFANKVSRARAYESAHQFGLAVDFVPWDNGRWSWLPTHDWDFLRRTAIDAGLVSSLSWDRAHVEADNWQHVKAAYNWM